MKSFLFSALVFLLIVTTSQYSCKQKENTDSENFSLVTNSGIDFTNTITNDLQFNVFTYRNFYNGGGVAIGDLNNDGLADVFLAANMQSNKLYINKGNWNFEDITKSAGLDQIDKWSTGVDLVDINNDGWLDIYVCNAGYLNGELPQNKLYINNHNLTFSDSTEKYGLSNKGGYCTHAAFFDYDLDGDLDCFIINNSFIPVNTLNYANKRDLRAKDWPVADFLKGGGDRLLRNDNGKFTDVSAEAGIYGSLISFGLGVTVGDVNGDNYPDVYVSNDFFERDYLYINQKNGTFKDELEKYIRHTSLSSMGADMGDINNDGYPDIFVTDMLPDDDYRLKTTSSFENIDVYKLKERSGFYHQYQQNTLQLNNQVGGFKEVGDYTGVNASDWSWGGLMFDADNDGLTDLYVCNGIYNDVTDQDFIDFFANDIVQKMVLTGRKEEMNSVLDKMPSNPVLNKFFKNEGNLKFVDAGKASGFTQPSFSNGAAYGDLDNDGDLDLVVNNVNEKCFVYRNNARQNSKNNYIGVILKGDGKNRFAIGSKINIYQGDQILTRELIPSRGFQSSVDYKTIIGLGSKGIDSLIITWPDITTTKLIKPSINRVITIEKTEADSKRIADTISSNTPKLLDTLTTSNFDKHQEDDFLDFYDERNVPTSLASQGPKSATGDVNGDGLTDVFICGASKQASQLYLQTTTGFEKKNEKVFNDFADLEDVTATFADVDGDKDLDLIIGSGGNNVSYNSKGLQLRLYKNDGKGNFTFVENALPSSRMNIGVLAAYDFDGDGDEDLFAGSRSMPHNYGVNPLSYLLVNDGKGNFTQMPASATANISNIGMITGATWANVSGDAKKELIIVGEYMYPHVYQYNNAKFSEVSTNLKDLSGWWQTVAQGDVDGDGDMDLILGNIGENFSLKPDSAHPVKLWVNDFDQNGTTETILSRTIDGRDKPVFLKRDITDEITTLKKQNLKHHDYANKSVQDLLPAAILNKSDVKLFNYAPSCVAINNANGNFTVQKLPWQVQLSSVNAALCTDVDHDGLNDLILCGNLFTFLPQFGRLDANYGEVLLNKANKGFTSVNSSISGLSLDGQVKDIQQIKTSKGSLLLFLKNNDYPALYKINQSAGVKAKGIAKK